MEVTALTPIPIRVPKRTRLRTSGTESTSGSGTFDHVLVRLETSTGVTGYGEVAPHPDWPESGTQRTVRSIIADEFVPCIEGESCLEVERLAGKLRAAVASAPFARFGVEAALYDAIGHHLGVPLYSLLGGPVSGDRSLPTHYTVGMEDPETVRQETSEAASDGYRDFKLKVGATDRDMDCRRLNAIREACPDARIRIDANGAWNPGEAVRAIDRLDGAADGIVFVEQPVARDDPAGLERVRSAVSPTVMADEGCYNPEDVALLARMDAVDAINVKLAKAGGITGARRVVATASAHNLPCYIGGMLELGIGSAASAHFALAVTDRSYPTGALNADATDTLLTNSEAWDSETPTVTVPDGDGLGIEVDENTLEQYRID